MTKDKGRNTQLEILPILRQIKREKEFPENM
jgi:hypothetical protein